MIQRSVCVPGRLESDGTSGGVAAKVSNLCFYLMTLIYSFTQVQDVSKKMSDLVGLTPRISELLEAFDGMNSTQPKVFNSPCSKLGNNYFQRILSDEGFDLPA